MPLTPFHLGLGILAKAIVPRHFSFQVFLLSQILIDVQPGLGLLFGWPVLHGWTHTYWGAALIGFLTALLWRGWEKWRPKRLGGGAERETVLFGSALFGTLSHVWLDSQFHAEMAALTPRFLHLLPSYWVNTACFVMLVVGCVVFLVRRARRG